MVLYEKILRALGKEKIKFLVVGGLAVNFHGYSRLTVDMDIIILLEKANIKKLLNVIKTFGLKPRVPVNVEDFADARKRHDWIKNKNMKAFALCNPENSFEHLDIVIEQSLDFKENYKRKMIIREGALQIPVISIKDLLEMKKRAGRDRDKIDILALRKIQELKND